MLEEARHDSRGGFMQHTDDDSNSNNNHHHHQQQQRSMELTRDEEAINKNYFESSSHGERIFQQESWWQTIYRKRCCICTSFGFLFFFIWWLTATNRSCWAKMSPPHTYGRNFNDQMFLPHDKSISGNSEASIATYGKKPNQEIRFIIVGNFGRDGFCYQTDTAFEIENAARTMKAAFIINTGNAFFPAGIMSPQDEQIDTSWRRVYDRKTLKTLKWYSILGEAESSGDVHSLLQFAAKDDRFVLEAPYYDKVFTAGVGDFSLHVFFLDTPTLIRTKKKQNDEQLVWLDQKLKESNSTVKMVVGFHTPFSDPTLAAFLVPILEGGDDSSGGAMAYFSGRERSLQWYKKSKTHYFISGAGAEMLKNENPFINPAYVSPTSGFLACSAGYHEKTEDPRIKVAFVSSVGEVSKVVDTSSS